MAETPDGDRGRADVKGRKSLTTAGVTTWFIQEVLQLEAALI